jgi:hypothetical protein
MLLNIHFFDDPLDPLKDLRAFVVRVKQPMQVDCLTLKIKPPRSFEVSVTIHQSKRRNVPEVLKRTLILFETFFGMLSINKYEVSSDVAVKTLA